MFSRDLLGSAVQLAAEFLVSRIGKRWSLVVLVVFVAVLISILLPIMLPVFA